MISLPTFVEACRLQNMSWTPDMGYLTAHFTHVPVFVYGPQKRTFSRNHLMAGGAFEGEGFTTAKKYTMFISKDKEPLAFSMPNHPLAARIEGEIWLIPLKTLFKIDEDMCNTLHHIRRWGHVQYHRQDELHKPRSSRTEYIAECMLWEGNYTDLQDFISDGRLTMMVRTLDETPFWRFTKADDKKEVF